MAKGEQFSLCHKYATSICKYSLKTKIGAPNPIFYLFPDDNNQL